ncbi:unnamed protein product [Vitrella brassicaformis CCMP3155]|uniref:Uncharacterized protein n=4 Tax=Vitrella brassicaformis TaxID=1169539 RepID=A0A0G4EN39_VITBC|nr:unnamed protein product [Vitrella brassicaformis CCMP3155]|eukprot:CEL99252.1 unnamed protein product [Vitrella brassicaformis CCMP3155]
MDEVIPISQHLSATVDFDTRRVECTTTITCDIPMVPSVQAINNTLPSKRQRVGEGGSSGSHRALFGDDVCVEVQWPQGPCEWAGVRANGESEGVAVMPPAYAQPEMADEYYPFRANLKHRRSLLDWEEQKRAHVSSQSSLKVNVYHIRISKDILNAAPLQTRQPAHPIDEATIPPPAAPAPPSSFARVILAIAYTWADPSALTSPCYFLHAPHLPVLSERDVWGLHGDAGMAGAGVDQGWVYFVAERAYSPTHSWIPHLCGAFESRVEWVCEYTTVPSTNDYWAVGPGHLTHPRSLTADQPLRHDGTTKWENTSPHSHLSVGEVCCYAGPLTCRQVDFHSVPEEGSVIIESTEIGSSRVQTDRDKATKQDDNKQPPKPTPSPSPSPSSAPSAPPAFIEPSSTKKRLVAFAPPPYSRALRHSTGHCARALSVMTNYTLTSYPYQSVSIVYVPLVHGWGGGGGGGEGEGLPHVCVSGSTVCLDVGGLHDVSEIDVRSEAQIRLVEGLASVYFGTFLYVPLTPRSATTEANESWWLLAGLVQYMAILWFKTSIADQDASIAPFSQDAAGLGGGRNEAKVRMWRLVERLHRYIQQGRDERPLASPHHTSFTSFLFSSFLRVKSVLVFHALCRMVGDEGVSGVLRKVLDEAREGSRELDGRGVMDKLQNAAGKDEHFVPFIQRWIFGTGAPVIHLLWYFPVKPKSLKDPQRKYKFFISQRNTQPHHTSSNTLGLLCPSPTPQAEAHKTHNKPATTTTTRGPLAYDPVCLVIKKVKRGDNDQRVKAAQYWGGLGFGYGGAREDKTDRASELVGKGPFCDYLVETWAEREREKQMDAFLPDREVVPWADMSPKEAQDALDRGALFTGELALTIVDDDGIPHLQPIEIGRRAVETKEVKGRVTGGSFKRTRSVADEGCYEIGSTWAMKGVNYRLPLLWIGVDQEGDWPAKFVRCQSASMWLHQLFYGSSVTGQLEAIAALTHFDTDERVAADREAVKVLAQAILRVGFHWTVRSAAAHALATLSLSTYNPEASQALIDYFRHNYVHGVATDRKRLPSHTQRGRVAVAVHVGANQRESEDGRVMEFLKPNRFRVVSEYLFLQGLLKAIARLLEPQNSRKSRQEGLEILTRVLLENDNSLNRITHNSHTLYTDAHYLANAIDSLATLRFDMREYGNQDLPNLSIERSASQLLREDEDDLPPDSDHPHTPHRHHNTGPPSPLTLTPRRDPHSLSAASPSMQVHRGPYAQGGRMMRGERCRGEEWLGWVEGLSDFERLAEVVGRRMRFDFECPSTRQLVSAAAIRLFTTHPRFRHYAHMHLSFNPLAFLPLSTATTPIPTRHGDRQAPPPPPPPPPAPHVSMTPLFGSPAQPRRRLPAKRPGAHHRGPGPGGDDVAWYPPPPLPQRGSWPSSRSNSGREESSAAIKPRTGSQQRQQHQQGAGHHSFFRDLHHPHHHHPQQHQRGANRVVLPLSYGEQQGREAARNNWPATLAPIQAATEGVLRGACTGAWLPPVLPSVREDIRKSIPDHLMPPLFHSDRSTTHFHPVCRWLSVREGAEVRERGIGVLAAVAFTMSLDKVVDHTREGVHLLVYGWKALLDVLTSVACDFGMSVVVSAIREATPEREQKDGGAGPAARACADLLWHFLCHDGLQPICVGERRVFYATEVYRLLFGVGWPRCLPLPSLPPLIPALQPTASKKGPPTTDMIRRYEREWLGRQPLEGDEQAAALAPLSLSGPSSSASSMRGGKRTKEDHEVAMAPAAAAVADALGGLDGEGMDVSGGVGAKGVEWTNKARDLLDLMSQRFTQLLGPFSFTVPPEDASDLSTVRGHLETGSYTQPEDFRRAMMRIPLIVRRHGGANSPESQVVDGFQQLFQQLYSSEMLAFLSEGQH